MKEQVKCPFCGTSYTKSEIATRPDFKCIICNHWVRRESKWVENPFAGSTPVKHETRKVMTPTTHHTTSDKKNVLQVSGGQIVARYSSPSEAAMMVNGNTVGIQRCLDGLQQTHAGYNWVYEE